MDFRPVGFIKFINRMKTKPIQEARVRFPVLLISCCLPETPYYPVFQMKP